MPRSSRLLAFCSTLPRQPIFSRADQGSINTGTLSRPISIASSPVSCGGDPGALSPSPIIRRSRPLILCSDSEEDGYAAAHPLAPRLNSTTSPAPTTVDPRVAFAFDAADSGDDGASVVGADSGDDGVSVDMDDAATVDKNDDEGGDNADLDNEKEGNGTSPSVDGATALDGAVDSGDDSGSAITISDDDDVISISDSESCSDNNETPCTIPPAVASNNELEGALSHVTNNPATPANASALSSSYIFDDGSGVELSSGDFDSDSDWGFPAFDDPELIDAIGQALDDPFGWGAGDGQD